MTKSYALFHHINEMLEEDEDEIVARNKEQKSGDTNSMLGQSFELTKDTVSDARKYIQKRRYELEKVIEKDAVTEEDAKKIGKIAWEAAVAELLPRCTNISTVDEFNKKMVELIDLRPRGGGRRKSKSTKPHRDIKRHTVSQTDDDAANWMMEDELISVKTVSPKEDDSPRKTSMTLIKRIEEELRDMVIGETRCITLKSDDATIRLNANLIARRLGWGQFEKDVFMYGTRRYRNRLYITRLG